MRVLLLGGTSEARALAAALVARDVDVVSSLAGRVSRPRLPVGEVRVGGFGGAAGLASALEGFDAVVDATHPFAATISASAAEACSRRSVPLVRLARPGWASHPDASAWHWVGSHDEAASTAASMEGAVLLTTGRQSLAAFTGPLASRCVLARVVERVDVPVPEGWTVLLGRGPYDLDSERALLRAHDVRVLVTKDSGGDLTRAKLDAAREAGASVVVVRRPPAPHGVEQVSDVRGVLRWLRRA